MKSGNLRNHQNSKHKNIKYTCLECGKLFLQNSYLKIHIRNVHEGKEKVFVSCPKCNYKSASGRMNKHYKSVHEGTIKYQVLL